MWSAKLKQEKTFLHVEFLGERAEAEGAVRRCRSAPPPAMELGAESPPFLLVCRRPPAPRSFDVVVRAWPERPTPVGRVDIGSSPAEATRCAWRPAGAKIEEPSHRNDGVSPASSWASEDAGEIQAEGNAIHVAQDSPQKARRLRSRPCKQKRARQNHLIDTIVKESIANPSFDLGSVRLPPHLAADAKEGGRFLQKVRRAQRKARFAMAQTSSAACAA